MHGTAGCIGYRRGDRSSRDRRQACATEAASRTREICELIRDPPRGRSRRNPRRCKSPRGCRCVIARRHTYLIGPHLRFAGNASARIGKIIALTQRHDPQTMDTFRASASLICTKAPIALPRARRPRGPVAQPARAVSSWQRLRRKRFSEAMRGCAIALTDHREGRIGMRARTVLAYSKPRFRL